MLPMEKESKCRATGGKGLWVFKDQTELSQLSLVTSQSWRGKVKLRNMIPGKFILEIVVSGKDRAIHVCFRSKIVTFIDVATKLKSVE